MFRPDAGEPTTLVKNKDQTMATKKVAKKPVKKTVKKVVKKVEKKVAYFPSHGILSSRITPRRVGLLSLLSAVVFSSLIKKLSKKHSLRFPIFSIVGTPFCHRKSLDLPQCFHELINIFKLFNILFIGKHLFFSIEIMKHTPDAISLTQY